MSGRGPGAVKVFGGVALPLPIVELKEINEYRLIGDQKDLDALPGMAPRDVEIRWVGSNVIGTEIVLRDAPSKCAIGLLQWARSSPSAYGSFWEKLYLKLRDKQEEDGGARDEADHQARLIERLREAAAADGNDVPVV